jgi:negative regulator of flagellin synthesis FlgM
MRIDSNQPLINQVVSDRAAKTSGKSGKSANSSGSSANDKATFSAGDAGISALEAQALSAPEVRLEKVQVLREAIQNGSYDVDAGQIADAMLRESGR